MAQNQFVCLSSDPIYSSGAIQNTDGLSGATAAGSSVVAHSDAVAHSAVVCGTDHQSVSGLSVGDSPQTGHAVASTGNDLAPTARFMEAVGMASEWR